MTSPNHKSRVPGASRIPASLLGAALVALGLAAIVTLGAAILTDAAVQVALDPTAAEGPSWVMAILDRFGLIVPLLTLGLGLGSVSLGARVARRNAAALRFGRDATGWAALFLAAVLAVRLFRVYFGDADASPAWLPTGAYGVGFLIAYLLRMGLARAAEAPDVPQEPLVAREMRSAWNLLIPALLILVMVAARPLEATVITSLTDKRFASDEVPNFVGLTHYRNLLTLDLDTLTCRRGDDGACLLDNDGDIRWDSLPRERLVEGYRTAWTWNLPLVTGPDEAISISVLDATWWKSVWVTIVFSVASVSLELLLGLFIALTVHSSFRGRGLMRAVMLIPWAIPTVVSARLWELMLKDTSSGVVNQFLISLGILDAPQSWLTTSALQLPSVVMIDVWKTSPFMALLLLAGLQVIPRELYESAKVDGASPIREFLSITLPLLRPAIGVALIFRTLDALRVFDLFQVLFGRSMRSVSTYNFEVLINNQQAGYAAAIGVLIFLLIFGFALLYVRVLGMNRQ